MDASSGAGSLTEVSGRPSDGHFDRAAPSPSWRRPDADGRSCRLSDSSAYAALEALPVAVAVTEGDRVVWVNEACARALARTREVLAGTPVSAWIANGVEAQDTGWVEAVSEGRMAGRPPPSRYWLRVIDGEGHPRTFETRFAEGPGAGQSTHVLIEAPVEADARALNDALAEASWRLVLLRDEQAVLDAAADVLLAQGFRVVMLRARGDQFFHVSLRQDPRAVLELAQTAGRPIEQMPLGREEAREFADCLERHRAIFMQDTHLLVDRFRPKEIARVIKAAMPRRGVAAPIFVEGEAFGVLTAQHDALTPATAGSIELFAHRIGSAIENVRHHRRAEERLAELARLQEKLLAQERLATLGEAAAVLAHEVRNPVATILNSLAVLRRNGTSAEALSMAEEDALRLERLVQNLLHLARPLHPHAGEVDLRTLADRTVAGVRRRTEPVNAELTVSGGHDLPVVADAFLLELALENLVVNALQAVKPGGQIFVRLEVGDETACIAVEDDGPGIRPEAARRLFEPFFTTRAAGTGLGLAIVRQVAEAHLGTARLTTTAQGHTRFELVFPREGLARK